jgi:hypothetical protein
VSGAAPLVLFVRPLPGVVGERDRVVHVVPVPDPHAIPEYLIAYCGARFGPGMTESLATPVGMPCVRCLAAAPISGTEQLPDDDRDKRLDPAASEATS